MLSEKQLAEYLVELAQSQQNYFTGTSLGRQGDGTVNVACTNGKTVNAIAANDMKTGDCVVFSAGGKYYAFSGYPSLIQSEKVHLNKRSNLTPPTRKGVRSFLYGGCFVSINPRQGIGVTEPEGHFLASYPNFATPLFTNDIRYKDLKSLVIVEQPKSYYYNFPQDFPGFQALLEQAHINYGSYTYRAEVNESADSQHIDYTVTQAIFDEVKFNISIAAFTPVDNLGRTIELTIESTLPSMDYSAFFSCTLNTFQGLDIHPAKQQWQPGIMTFSETLIASPYRRYISSLRGLYCIAFWELYATANNVTDSFYLSVDILKVEIK